MTNSIIVGGLKCGMDVSVACPKDHHPHKTILDFAKSVTDACFKLTDDPRVAAHDADIIFTDVWASMGQEHEIAERQKTFSGYCVDNEIIELAKPSCMVLHCLPAHRDEEITEEVFEKHSNEIFDEAENRLHVQKAIMYLLMK
jgi:ornithine carbamoyltransferase